MRKRCLGLGLKEESEKERMKRAERADEEERMKREKITEIMEEREIQLKYIFFFLQLCYSTILKIELYCSTIVKFFTISVFSIL